MFNRKTIFFCLLIAIGVQQLHGDFKSICTNPSVIKAQAEILAQFAAVQVATQKTTISPYKEYAAQNIRNTAEHFIKQQEDTRILYRAGLKATSAFLDDLAHLEYVTLKNITCQQLITRNSIKKCLEAWNLLKQRLERDAARLEKEAARDERAQAFYELEQKTADMFQAIEEYVRVFIATANTQSLGELVPEAVFNKFQTKLHDILIQIVHAADTFDAILAENDINLSQTRAQIAKFDRMATSGASCAALNRQALTLSSTQIVEIISSMEHLRKNINTKQIDFALQIIEHVRSKIQEALANDQWFAQLPIETQENFNELQQKFIEKITTEVVSKYAPQFATLNQ